MCTCADPKASCVLVCVICVKGGLGQGIPESSMRGFLGGKLAHLSLAKSTLNQLDHLGVESPLSLEHDLP